MAKFPSPTFSQLLKNPIHLLAFGFGSGLAPKAPGTFGTLLAVLLYLPLATLSLWAYVAVVVFASIVGVYLCDRTAKDLGVHDHPGIVWDEFAGFWLTMIAIPATWEWILAGFILFRIFDIWKPWPIGWCDKRVDGGFGIMVDDLLAGLYSWLILMAFLYF
jgi:phosphatidylglycerophosphatase A